MWNQTFLIKIVKSTSFSSYKEYEEKDVDFKEKVKSSTLLS